jgi:hypothetical protein
MRNPSHGERGPKGYPTETGVGRDRNGVTGLYTDITEDITPFEDVMAAIQWCESQGCFYADDIEKHFGEALEEA